MTFSVCLPLPDFELGTAECHWRCSGQYSASLISWYIQGVSWCGALWSFSLLHSICSATCRHLGGFPDLATRNMRMCSCVLPEALVHWSLQSVCDRCGGSPESHTVPSQLFKLDYHVAPSGVTASDPCQHVVGLDQKLMNFCHLLCSSIPSQGY